MTTGRGREAKVRPQFRGLYPRLQTTEWEPVEAVLQQVAETAKEDRANAELTPGSRLLPDEHFEFRGTAPRPQGSASRRSRVTDREVDHQGLAGLQRQLDAEHDLLVEREHEAEQTIARAERLRERVDALQREFERLRESTAQLDFRPEHPRKEPNADAAGERVEEA